MIFALYVIGIIVLVISLVSGISSDSLVGFLASAAGGISFAIINFALAKILENQEEIKNKLMYQEGTNRRVNIDKKVCKKCNYEYDSDCSSCPHCGARD